MVVVLLPGVIRLKVELPVKSARDLDIESGRTVAGFHERGFPQDLVTGENPEAHRTPPLSHLIVHAYLAAEAQRSLRNGERHFGNGMSAESRSVDLSGKG